ncbi:MAG: MFS transporter [Oscillospiraceae bacterium]|nr:MFS transporter [Oscillospiraceae bacterium]
MSTTTGGILKASADKKNVKPAEFIWYLIAVFFYTNMTGFVGQYRNVFLVDVVQISNKQSSLFNVITSIVPYILNFFIVMYIDGRNIGKKGKFRPLIMLAAIPMGILLFLSFWVPKGISGALLMIYIITVAILWSVMNTFGGTINNLAVVMTPNLKERDTIMSFRGIVSAVGNSASLVIIVVLNIIWKDNQALQFIVCAAMSGVLGIITMLTGMNIARERITYDNEKKNPIAGFGDILKNKYAWTIIISEFLKNFRGIANFMGPFLAAALLGSSSKFLLFGLPTGIGTAVGMLIINFLLKKFDSRTLYIASGIYSIIANTAAFAIGYTYFKQEKSGGPLQIVFIIFLFLIGLQFGASNLLPNMLQADVLEDIELKTGKRLDSSLPFVIGIFTMISGTIAGALQPFILYGDNSICGYVQGIEDGTMQSLKTKIWMLFFYTIFHGIMMFIAGVPFFFYKLTGKRKEEIHEALLEQRKQYNSVESVENE